MTKLHHISTFIQLLNELKKENENIDYINKLIISGVL